ncbi:MAG: hypothetical protein NT154_22150, partial [Verrucomicrobia bacterium]|nr:hypothetical protein [Verrucomicrobiota bacterium]
MASIRARAGFSTVLWGSIGANNCSLIWRKPLTPQCSRNWFNIHTSGTAWRLDKWAKRRQSRCSASNRIKWLKAWTGVSTLKRLARYSCAELSCWRRPRPPWRGSNSLMKVSGIYGESSFKNCAVPVAGNFESMALGATPKRTLRPGFLAPSNFSTINKWLITAYAEFPNTLYYL